MVNSGHLLCYINLLVKVYKNKIKGIINSEHIELMLGCVYYELSLSTDQGNKIL